MVSSPTLAQSVDDEDAGLWAAFKGQGSAKAREALFSRHMPLARRIARRHFRDRSGDIELPDLCQWAYAGLLEAIDRFDASFGVSFGGFASKRIAGSILDGIAKTSEMREQLSFRSRLRAERAKSLSVEKPEDLDSANAMQALIDAAIGLAIGFMFEGTTIYMPGDAPDRHVDAYESLAWKEAIQRLTRAVQTLSEREQLIIRSHYLDGVAFDQLAVLLGVSKGRISQLHRRALMALRTNLQSLDSFALTR